MRRIQTLKRAYRAYKSDSQAGTVLAVMLLAAVLWPFLRLVLSVYREENTTP
jgi:hypothetical protein